MTQLQKQKAEKIFEDIKLAAEYLGYDIKYCKMDIQNVPFGRAWKYFNYFIIPEWAVKKNNKAFTIYYISHEISHIVNTKNLGNHDKFFKKIETKFLHMFGINPIYGKKYIKILKDLKTDKILYEHKMVPKGTYNFTNNFDIII